MTYRLSAVCRQYKTLGEQYMYMNMEVKDRLKASNKWVIGNTFRLTECRQQKSKGDQYMEHRATPTFISSDCFRLYFVADYCIVFSLG